MPPAFACSLPGCEITTVSQSDHGLTITAHTTAPTAGCPRCGISSQRIHSYYTRRPRDLPLWDEIVRLVLRVRRFRCLNATCTTQTFAERLPALVRPAAPRTVRLTMALQQLGLARGGEAGARLGTSSMPTSPDPWLRLVRQLPAATDGDTHHWEIGHCGGGVRMAPCWWTWSAIRRSTCCPTARLTPSPHGSGHIRASSSSVVTARRSMRVAPP